MAPGPDEVEKKEIGPRSDTETRGAVMFERNEVRERIKEQQ